MNLYLDSSALVKRYLVETGSSEVVRMMAEAKRKGTVAISRAEVIAALAKAVRMGALTQEEAESAREVFQREWRRLGRFRITDLVLEMACDLAWKLGLRGYDSVQLAAAALWQATDNEPVVMITFDGRLWEAAASIGLKPYPKTSP